MPVAFFIIYRQAPFLRLLIPTITGIMLQWYLPCYPFYNWIALMIAGSFTCLSLIIKGFIQFRNQWIAGLFINLMLIYTGRLLVHYSDTSYRTAPENAIFFIASIESPLAQKAKSFSAEACIRFIADSFRSYPANEKINIYFGFTGMPDLSYGSRILFQKTPVPIQSAAKTQTFDFKKYAALQHIHRQLYLSPNDFILLPEKSANGFTVFVFNARKKLISILHEYIPGKEECSLLEALLFGYTGDLDKEVRQSYTNAGVVHIIAISGLHLALIYSILQFIFHKMQGKGALRWVRMPVLLSALWLFSLIAGAAPSVLRSAIMLTTTLLGNHFMRPASVYNSLALSAFLLLCYNPLWLWDIGFQLSYLAVLGIVIFRKPISECIPLKNKLLLLLWNASAVSLSAQVLTTPLSIYYFHQFPNYFLPTNLVAVPLSSAILTGGLLLCVFACFPALATMIGWVVSRLTFIMNRFIEYMSHLPFSLCDHLNMSFFQLILSYLLVLAASIWLFNRD